LATLLNSEEERNRIIKTHDLNVLYLTGPGHGEPALVASAYLEGT
jgi:xylulose-5-phosphate/fructose-6-phosphate phosphoketolase